jgi:hypothetical protein
MPAQLVEVSFDPVGGMLADDVRVVPVGGVYGSNANLYPGDRPKDFLDLPSDKITLADGLFTVSIPSGGGDRWCNFWAPAVEKISVGRDYTYVADIVSIDGRIGSWDAGQTGGYWPPGQRIQLQGRTILSNVSTTGVVATVLCAIPPEFEDRPLNCLDRGYLTIRGGDKCEATFRVAVFAGRGVTAENYSPVAPGEALVCPLPVPTWEDHVFLCWTNSLGEAVTDATSVTNSVDHVLGAMWKEWRVDIAGAERPRASSALTASTNYGEGDGEDGAVSFAWHRGDYSGAYEASPVSATAEYVPAESDYAHYLKAVVLVDGRPLAEKAIWFSRLPVAYVETADGKPIVAKEDLKAAHLRIQGNAEWKQQYDGAMEIKGRGNTSWNFPKKPYKLKLDKKTDLFGFGKNKHWVLLANFIDESHLRNKAAYDMSGRFGLEYMDSTWVDVVFNGAYAGLYQLCEHIRVGDTRVDIVDWEDSVEDEEDLSTIDADATDISGGYLFELSNEYDELSKFTIGSGLRVMLKKPEFLYTNPAMMDWCSNFWERVHASWRSVDGVNSAGESWLDLCDVDSLVSYWLVQDIFGNDDAWYKSRFAYKDVGGKLTFGPVWDFDWGCGTSSVGTNNVCTWRLANANYSEYVDSFYKEWLDDPWFCLQAMEKYAAMRPALEEVASDGGTLDRAIDRLAESGAADDALWDAARRSAFGGRKRGFAADAAIFKWWMATRLAWLDSQFARLETLMSSVRNGASAHPYEKRADRIAISVSNATGRGNFSESDFVARGGYAVRVETDVSDAATASLDVSINGRPWQKGIVVEGGKATFVIPGRGWTPARPGRALVEAVGRDVSGALTFRSYATILPQGGGPFSISLR